MTPRPTLTSPQQLEDATRAVTDIVAELQRGLDRRSAKTYNAAFSADVVWGGPYGATVTGYENLHAIHQRLMAQGAAGPSRYEIVTIAAPAPDTAIAQVRRTPLAPGDQFAEMALYVLIKHGGRWWLAAGQNTPIQPARSATDT